MSIYKAYDIRGIYGKDLTDVDAYLFGYYLIKHTKIEKIKIAHDLRLSHEPLTKFLIQGILDSNCEINYLGASSTPNFYFSLFSGINSGIMVTASHNPKEYNGFKIILEGDSFDSRNGLYDIEKLVKEDLDNRSVYFNQIKNSIEAYSLNDYLLEHEIKLNSNLSNYVDFLKSFYEIILTEKEKEIIEKLKVNLDFSSGVSSLAVCKFLEEEHLNFNFHNEKPDGNFPIHSPDPMNAISFMKTISKECSFGAAFDGDGDRIVFYDENKELVLPDYTIALLIDYFISENHKDFVCDLRVSKVISEMCIDRNVKLNLMRVGRAFYKSFLDENNSIFGAELSGHFFFRDFKNFDNPDMALIFMLKTIAKNILEDKNITFSKILSKYKKYSKLKEENIRVKDADKVLDYLKDKYSRNIESELDGLSIDMKDYWFNIRKSNTEPVLKINLEGNTQNQLIKELYLLKEAIENI